MTDYTFTAYQTGVKASVKDAIEALETQMETVANTKTIRLIGIEKAGTGGFVGYALYDT